MCGIIGYIGHRPASRILVSGLSRLEYRGYDSAGIALCETKGAPLEVVKTKGKISDLERSIEESGKGGCEATIGIGHTRWATHGIPSQANAHPHVSQSGRFAVVHNGIIENYKDLKLRLTKAGYEFKSETDSEVITHLIDDLYEGDLLQAVTSALNLLHGTYGICVLSNEEPGLLVAARKGSPIVVGVCEDETIIASDISAIINHTNQVIFLDDGDVVTARADHVEITSHHNAPVSRSMTEIDWDVGDIEKGGHEHFMLKEIYEQPASLANTIGGRLLPDEGTSKLSGMQMDPAEMASIDRIMITACGTSMYAGMVGKYYFEEFGHIQAVVEQAAEFRYRNPIIERNTCMLAISQSGETADTLAAVREAKRKGSEVLGICNVVGSTIAREAGRGVYLHAGPEIGVASTKAFSSQVAVMAMMALGFGRTRRMSLQEGTERVKAIAALPELVQQVIDREDEICKVAEAYAEFENFFYMGRGYQYPAALEGALKLKEISYIHAEGYHAAELKHGPIALLGEKVPVVAAVPRVPGQEKTIGNMQECIARKSPVIAIGTEGDKEIREHCSHVITIPDCPEFISPIPVVVAEQIFAYHVARLRGCEIDQPRNLAKSVTVE